MSRDALVVGINTYTHLKSLKAPATDAEEIAKILETDGDFQTVRRLPEAIAQTDSNQPVVGETLEVSQLQLKKALKQLFRPDSSQAPDTALFYFSGHGIPDTEGYDKGYLATSDTHPSILETGVSLRWLQWLLSESPVKQQIIWLDCCHSGGLLVNVESANPGHGERRDRCFIASSRDFEQSWQDLNSPYSVLTQALLDGLDPTRLQGRWVDSFALVDYVNQALKGELQKPICTNFGEAINLTRTWQVETDTIKTATEANEICPYKGLEYFDFNDEDPKYFFGRDQLTGQLLDQVRTSNFMALVGASGNGKSSVLRAGLLHQLKLGRRITGSDQWRIRLTRPDRQPLRNLALAFVDENAPDLERAEQLGRSERLIEKGADGLRRLVQTDSAPKVILVIDQFEEVFTRCENVEEREQFFACIMGALAETEEKLCLILALRADFVGKCLERDYSGLADRVQQGMVNVLPMALDDLRDAICNPAEQVGLIVEPALLTEILDDIAGAPGSLPLLQYTLKELWHQRQNNQLVLSAYHALGGINGTLDKKATEIYSQFDEAEQRTVQHIFQQLTQLGEDTEDTRRRVFQENLVAEPKHSAEQVNRVIATLAAPENRLLVTSEVISKGSDAERMAIVDVAHEALIRHWRLLRQWIEKNRDLLRQHRKIEQAAEEWQSHRKTNDYLLSGRQLTDTRLFQKNYGDRLPLSSLSCDYLLRSLSHRRNSRMKLIGFGAIVPLALATYTGIQLATYYRLKPHWDLVYSFDAETNPIGRNSLVRAVEHINSAGRSLSGINLSSADLSSADLSSADLNKADLNKADLGSADLSSANLSSANLSSADLSSANLSSADLIDAYLSSADLNDAYLNDAYLGSADLSSANLSSADLNKANLGSANLSSADLSSADLSSAYLNKANLGSANLSSANLSSAYLSSADLNKANLSSADLNKANLGSANLSSANLGSADLSSADLNDADLSSADLNDANLRSADLIDADLSSANLSSANLGSANLSSADLIDADLSSADLIDADLSSANLSSANLSSADLRSANLSSANLRSANLSSAILLAIDLREFRNLTAQQLQGDDPPLLCNVALPSNISEAKIDPNRDCDRLPEVLSNRYWWIEDLGQAQQIVDESRQKVWEE
ncbi:MAG: pentapeptide repeat-containing protein [Elainellaceae cyanobacterium]